MQPDTQFHPALCSARAIHIEAELGCVFPDDGDHRTLQRPLLLIHGLTDDNVYAQHSMQLADALFTAGKSFNFLPLLGTHMVSEPIQRLRRQTRIMDFFDAELKAK